MQSINANAAYDVAFINVRCRTQLAIKSPVIYMQKRDRQGVREREKGREEKTKGQQTIRGTQKQRCRAERVLMNNTKR